MHRTATSILKVAWTHPRQISCHAFYDHQTLLFLDNLQHVKETCARDGVYTKAKRDPCGGFLLGGMTWSVLNLSKITKASMWKTGWVGEKWDKEARRLFHKTINYNDLGKEVDRCAYIKEVMWEFLMINRMWKGEEEEIIGHS